MKVPYATKWRKETDALRTIAVECGLSEATKWGKRCFTAGTKNVAIVIPLKESCALSFFKGALLADPDGVLSRIGQAQAGRWIKFTSPQQVARMRRVVRAYLQEAIDVEARGLKVTLKPASAYEVPRELQARLDRDPALRKAFDALTPGRRKSYILHIANAKQEKTRAARTEKCVPAIMSGRGFLERRT